MKLAGMNSPPGALAGGTAGAVFVSGRLTGSTLAAAAGPGDSPFGEPALVGSALAEAGLDDSPFAESALPESALPESALAESALAESALAGSTLTGSIFGAVAPVDSQLADSARVGAGLARA